MLKEFFYLTIASVVSITNVRAAESLDIEPLTKSADIWRSSQSQIARNFPDFKWKDGEQDGVFEYKSKGMVFWGEPVRQLSMVETEGEITTLRISILDKETAMSMKRSDFDSFAKRWNKILEEKLKTEGTRIPTISVGKVESARLAWDGKDSVIVLSANLEPKPVGIELIYYERDYGIGRMKLRGKQLVDGEDEGDDTDTAKADSDTDEFIDESFAPTEVKREIRSKIKEINARKAPDGVSKKVQDAVNLLNVYRFLSRVPYDVKADKGMIKEAMDAAKICAEKGQLSHDFGHSTDKCNLAMNSGDMSMEKSVAQYMEDSGANNRERRGHRRWCINHKMKKTGFGIEGAYSAMYSMDQSDRGIRKNYSYPGHGFYPKEYLHGNGWSYHIVDGKAPSDCVIKVWQLKKFQVKPPKWSDEPDGKAFDVAFKHIYSDTIVFEPDSQAITKRGTYLVRLEGSGFKEQYLVHLY